MGLNKMRFTKGAVWLDFVVAQLMQAWARYDEASQAFQMRRFFPPESSVSPAPRAVGFERWWAGVRALRPVSVLAVAAVLCAACAGAWGQVNTTQTLSLGFSPVASVNVTTGTTVTLTAAGGFAPFTNTTTTVTIQFSIRTTYSTGTGSITAATTNFTSGGNSIPAANLKYNCGASSVGTSVPGRHCGQHNLVAGGLGHAGGIVHRHGLRRH